MPVPDDPATANPVMRGLSLLWLSRPDSLMWGVGLAVLNAKLPEPLPERWRRWLPRVGLVGLVVVVRFDARGEPVPLRPHGQARAAVPVRARWDPSDISQVGDRIYWINFGHTVTALAFMPAMLAMARHKEWFVNRGLSWGPLRYLGRMSYTVYVWHTLVYFIVLDLLGGNDVLGQKWRAPILAVITIVACLPDLLRRGAAHAAGEAALRRREGGPGPQHRQDGARSRWRAPVTAASSAPRRSEGPSEGGSVRRATSSRRGPVTATSAPRGFVSKAPKLGLVGGFDGIRGIGVCMVLVGHALFEYVESWVTIVDTFFVLSGFLITTLLLQEARTTGGISLKKFYTRRGIRLFPSLWLFVGVWLLISTIATLVGFEPLSLRYVGQDAAAALLYVYHLFFPNGNYVIEPVVQEHRTMWHLWTLSVEEWFYAVIAGTVLVCVRKRWIAQLGLLMGGGLRRRSASPVGTPSPASSRTTTT